MARKTAKAAARPRRRDWQETRAKVLEAAIELFRDEGPSAITMSAVAERADVNRSTVHRHFASRDELLWAVSDCMVRDMGVQLEGPIAAVDLSDDVDAIVHHFIDHPAQARRLLRGLCRPEATEAGLEQLDREIAMMQLLAVGGLGKPGIDAEVLGVINLAGVLLWSVLNDAGVVSGGADRYRAEVLRFLLHGAIDGERVPVLLRATSEGTG
jgi:AcrR family transcriptional regulator